MLTFDNGAGEVGEAGDVFSHTLSTVWQLVVRYTRSGCVLVPGTQPLTLIQRKTEITIAGTNPNLEP